MDFDLSLMVTEYLQFFSILAARSGSNAGAIQNRLESHCAIMIDDAAFLLLWVPKYLPPKVRDKKLEQVCAISISVTDTE